MGSPYADLTPYAKYVLDVASYVSIAFAILGLIVSLILLLSIFHTRRKLRQATTPETARQDTYLDGTLISILIIIILYSILVVAENIIWVVDFTALAPFLGIVGYFLVYALFALNIRLAFERQSLVNRQHQPRQLSFNVNNPIWVQFVIFIVPTLFFVFHIAAFAISSKQNWLLIPFSTPNTSDNLPNTLFLIGMLYFPLAAISTISIYAFSYYYAMESFDKTQVELQSISQISAPTNTTASLLPSKPSFRRAVILRCTIMSLGLIVFYIPTIFCVFWRVTGKRAEIQTYPKEDLWLYFWLNVLPALDCVWTPGLILWFQERYREELFLWILEWIDFMVGKLIS